MKSKFATFIISIVIILIIIVFGIFGYIFWQEYQEMQETFEPEPIKTEISSSNDKNANKEENIKNPQVVESGLDNIEDPNSSTNIDYSNIDIDKFFYNQLNDYSKTIYNAFEANKENMKTGTYQIEFGDAFSSLLESENGEELLGDYYQSAIEAYTYDNPDVFYLNPNEMYLNINTKSTIFGDTYSVYINNAKDPNYLIEEFNSKEEIDMALNSIEQVKNQILQNRTSDTYENVKMVHDYLIDNIEYDTTISKENIYNIYGALVNKEAVCEGYARSFKYLMDELNIPCTIVIGEATNSKGETENHAWNYVQIEGTWYAIDTTWDDPVSRTGIVSESSKYKYFLKTKEEFSKDHIPSTQFTKGGKEFSYPI